MNELNTDFLNDTIDTNAPDLQILAEEGETGAYVSKVTVKPTKKNNGAYLELELILDNKMRVWEIFCLKHENPKTVQLARESFKKAIKSMGIDGSFELSKYRELVDRMCRVKIIHQEYEGKKQAKVGDWLIPKKEDDFKNF